MIDVSKSGKLFMTIAEIVLQHTEATQELKGIKSSRNLGNMTNVVDARYAARLVASPAKYNSSKDEVVPVDYDVFPITLVRNWIDFANQVQGYGETFYELSTQIERLCDNNNFVGSILLGNLLGPMWIKKGEDFSVVIHTPKKLVPGLYQFQILGVLEYRQSNTIQEPLSTSHVEWGVLGTVTINLVTASSTQEEKA